MTQLQVDRIDNEDGTHTLLVNHVQVGPPIKWDDTTTEHYVRETCRRLAGVDRPLGPEIVPTPQVA